MSLLDFDDFPSDITSTPAGQEKDSNPSADPFDPFGMSTTTTQVLTQILNYNAWLVRVFPAIHRFCVKPAYRCKFIFYKEALWNVR